MARPSKGGGGLRGSYLERIGPFPNVGNYARTSCFLPVPRAGIPNFPPFARLDLLNPRYPQYSAVV